MLATRSLTRRNGVAPLDTDREAHVEVAPDVVLDGRLTLPGLASPRGVVAFPTVSRGSLQSAYNRLAVSQQLLDQSNLALDLAQTRYKLGLGSIVELSQAQLQQTQADIGNAQAGYEYRLALSVLRYQTSGL